MQEDTGQIFPTKEILKIIEKNPEKKFISLPFQIGDIVKLMEIKFKVTKIKKDRVILKGIPQ